MTPIEEARLRLRQICNTEKTKEAAAAGLELAAALLEGQQQPGTALLLQAEANRTRNG